LCIIAAVKRIAKWLTVSILVFLVLIGVVAAWRYRLQERAREKREAEYDLARRTYAAVLQPGITRKDVEDYLRRNNVVTSSRSPDELLIKIGQEDPPWFCSDSNVYVKFQFDHHGQNPAQWLPRDSDILIAITVLHWSDKCL
jgi:hypothetical protein